MANLSFLRVAKYSGFDLSKDLGNGARYELSYIEKLNQ